MTIDIVVAGKLAIDELSFEGKKYPPVLGGSAAHFAIAAATVGRKVAIVSSIGSDFPEKFWTILESKGIDLSGVIRRSGPTSHFWADFAKDGSMMDYRLRFGVGNQIPLKPFSNLTKQAKAVHLGILPPHLQRTLIHRVYGTEKIISMTTIFHQAKKLREKILPQLSFIDILFVNDTEAQLLTNLDNSLKAIQKLGKMVSKVIVTQGATGCLVNEKGIIMRFPSYHVEQIEATGAGDSFAGAFIANYIENDDIRLAARWGNAAGALNVREIGSAKLAKANRQDLEDLIINSQ